MTIIYRAIQGSDLSADQIDGNFHDLDDRVATIEGATIKSISSIAASGSTMTITFSDASTQTITLPTISWSDLFIGAWPASTPVTKDQIFMAQGALYVVLMDHTTASTFDPGANDGAGHDYYKLLLKLPNVATKTRTGTIFNPTLSDANTYNRMTNAAGCTVNIPPESDINFPLDTEMHFRQVTDSGQVLMAWQTSTTVNGVKNFQPLTAIQGSVLVIKKVGIEEWDLFGFLAPV